MADAGMKWYVLRAISGKEGKVKEVIDALINNQPDFAKHVSQVLIPTEKVVTVSAGKRKIKEKNRYPGYVFVEAELVGETQARLRNVSNVMGFLSDSRTSNVPMPLRPSEVSQMLGTIDELAEIPEDVVIPFEVGESIKVSDGPFSGFDAVVEEVNNEKKKLKVMVKIFGRKTPVELYNQMAKEVAGLIKLQIKGGAANPSPPVGPALGSKGINIMDFCKAFNARTQDRAGKVLPVVITYYTDKSYDFIVKTPPVAVQLIEAAKVKGGSAEPNRRLELLYCRVCNDFGSRYCKKYGYHCQG